MRPLIGITSDIGRAASGRALTQLGEVYSSAIAEAGGTPVLIPSSLDTDSAEDLVSSLRGILFSGGGDIEPWRYDGNSIAPLIELSPSRDALELDLLHRAVGARMPFLGICRGCQLVNVALGGTLYEDLDTEPGSEVHHNVPGKESPAPAHDVKVAQGTLLAEITRMPSFGVNSHHHQGLRVVPPSLRISARAPDGLAECIELPDHPFGLAVQWHPEWLTRQEWTRQLFSRFVAASRGTL